VDYIYSSSFRNDMHNPPMINSTGTAKSTINVLGESLVIYSYTPPHIAADGVLFLFDGLHRNAAGIRDKATSLADRYGMMLIAPQMDKVRFPKWRYNYAGVVCDGGLLKPRAWTGRLIQELIDQTLDRINHDPSLVCLFGHSAGAQLLSRVCAYSPLSGVNAVIVTNPSSYVFPLLDVPAPFGFEVIFSRRRARSMLKSYLAAPMTIYLGMEDTEDLHLSNSKYPMLQGRNRVERGRNLYRLGYKVAQLNRFSFNWRLVEIPGVGHSSREMLELDNFGLVLRSQQIIQRSVR
jgi:hypothetical protein